MKKHILIGLGAATLLLLIYVGIITLAQGLSHAISQTRLLWYWVLALAAGFGTQAALYFYLRQGMKSKGATASVATSGGVSAGSMAACCAHHLSDVLLVRFQVFFIVVGVVSNVVGIIIMLESIQRHHPTSPITNWKLNLGKVKIGVLIIAPIILAGVFFLTQSA
ncbi:MAG: hypothetical protein HW384_2153 [Dehalococcoidia bacterium]|nr:hypothetical protein [Dehalococcoidia bacterium]